MAEDAVRQRGAGLTLRLDPEAGALIATVVPDASAAPIDEAWLKAHIDSLGFGALRYLPAAATILLGKYNAGAPVAALPLAECVDAGVSVSLASDHMSAMLTIVPAQGGAPATQDAILAALAELGVVRGILQDVIDQAVTAQLAENLIIAAGQPPEHGLDGRFETLLQTVRNRTPHIDDTGHIDYRDLGEIAVVHPGDQLMLRHPPTDGTAGIDLLGQPVPAHPGKDTVFAPGLTGVSIATDNPNLLVAAIVGQPLQVTGGMVVEPVYSIGEVGTASGNINFDGSVVIKGDVAAGMMVHATGDIEVGGMVEVATLEAGGSIVIKGGAMGSLGRKEGGDHHFRCGASFHAAYVQQARIEAGDSIFIDDTVMQCELSAMNYVLVGDKKRGCIIGGRTQATLSIKAKVLGSPNRVTTLVEIGVNPAMQKKLHEMAKQRDARETQLLEVSKLLEFAHQHPERIRPEMLEKARQAAAALANDIAAMREAQDELTRKIQLSMQSRVVAEQAMYEGVEVHMGGHRYRVVGERGPGAIGLTKGGLGPVSPDDDVKPT